MKAMAHVWMAAALGIALALTGGVRADPPAEVEVEICPRCGEVPPEGGCPMGEDCQLRLRTESGPGVKPGISITVDGRGRVFVNGREVGVGTVGLLGSGAWAWSQSGGGYLGVAVEPLSEEAAKKSGAPGGALVVRVEDASPAEKAGLKAGDVISAVGNKGVNTPGDLVSLVSDLEPGSHVAIAYWRDGKEQRAGVTIGERRQGPPWPEGDWFQPFVKPPAKPEKAPPSEKPERPDKPAPPKPGEAKQAQAYLGIMVTPLGDDMKKIAGTDKGVLINTLLDDSPAAKVGLLAGDVITEVDGREVTEPEAFVDLIRGHKPGDKVRITYWRMGRRDHATVVLGRRPERMEGPAEPWELPDVFPHDMPQLRQYLERLRPDLDDLRRRWHEREEPRPAPPEAAEPYGVGKDIGRLLERLDRIEKRLDAIQERLDRMERR
jgi:membrane-associated protease RseP (regulator of RpoE activity)